MTLGPLDRIILKRIVVCYPVEEGGSRYVAGTLEGYGGNDLLIDFNGYGRHSFSRGTGRWLEGDCTNFVYGHIVDFQDVDKAIRASNVWMVYEGNHPVPSVEKAA